ncbi:hybrid sensor histidine kinase/response regulator [Mucilaginibacter gotjawali]|nr:two-component regulator propeller domain-containing protein [Mucilaginibacter gotjawali]MBB3057654.1 signal transduction histidine kinase/ligand-binding sensor domain-containing protein/DNA-binding NarL/FixJ family response regulator [Mucilaginibacter gotjawali]
MRSLNIIFFLMTVFYSHSGYGQIDSLQGKYIPGLKNYAIKTYNHNSGLPSNSTTCVIKDKNGFLWVGTENGLCRFDGYTFKTFINIPGDSTSLTNNYINVIVEDKRGRIWVGTLDGLNLLDPYTEKFKRFIHQERTPRSLSNNKIWCLLADRENNIWVGTDDGFNKYTEKTQNFDVYQPDSRDANAIKGKSVNAIIEDANNNLWLGNWSGGLNMFNKHTRKFLNFPQPQRNNDRNPNDVWTLSLDEDGKIWVGTYWEGLFRFDMKTKAFTPFQSPYYNNHAVFRILNLGNHLMLLDGNEGYFWFNSLNNSWQQINNFTSFQQAGLFQDKSGIIWLCSMEGLTKLDKQQYKFSFFPFSDTKRAVKSIIVKDHSLWIGTNNGLTVLQLNNHKTTTFLHSGDPLSIGNNDINKLYLDTKGKLWVLTEFGFNEYDDKTGKFTHHSHHSTLGSLFNEDVFRDILEVNLDEYYLATDAGLKIYHSKTNTITHYYNQKDKPYSLSNNHLYCLLKDADNKIWIGTQGGGLDRFDQVTHRFTNYQANGKKGATISSNTIHDIFLDSHKNVWVCTQDGLNKYVRSSNSFLTYSTKDGFASNVFKRITEDNNGNLWVITETGVSSLNPGTMKIENFDEDDGVFASSAIFKQNDDQMFLAGNKGIVSFNPLNINYNKQAPPVYFSDFQIFNKSVVPGANSVLKEPIQNAKEIVLNYDQSVFSIEFVALNYTHTEKNNYAYKLDGFDKRWNYVGPQRKATYTNLNPGTYTFRVKASNNDGVWNNSGRSLTIVITPPWYLTWWACLIYISLFVAAVYGYIVYNNRQAKLKYEIKLAHIESEKEKELHEKKLSFFTNISHEFRTPLTLIINPLKDILYAGGSDMDRQNLNTINRNAKRLLSLVDQLLLFRKADAEADDLKLAKINIVDLSKEVFLCFSHQAGVKNLQFEYVCQDEYIELIADHEKIEIVLFNLLSNAIKFTEKGGRIKLHITQTPEFVHIQVEDTGCGIMQTAGEKLFNKFYQEYQYNSPAAGGLGIGLFLVKNYVERHGGEISYQSEIGQGTTFYVQLLKGRSHFKSTTVIEEAPVSSVFFKELMEEDVPDQQVFLEMNSTSSTAMSSDFKSILIIEDNKEIREYLNQIFKADYIVYETDDGESGLKMVSAVMPDIVISDVMMPGLSGIEVCARIKDDPDLNHIPVILLTAITSPEIKLKGIEGGADDYISKPFEKEMLMARVKGILKSRNNLQRYFFNEITLKPNNLKISQEYKDFLQKCIDIVEQHLNDPDFSIKTLANEIGMSHSNLYRKIKSISGQSANGFIRFIRLRKAAEIFLKTDSTVYETAYKVGLNDLKYFREQFSKLFGLNPSDYIKKYRNAFHRDQNMNRNIIKED